MTDQQKPAQSKPVESASANPGEQRSTSRRGGLAKASESGDAEVHKLLADRQTAQMNAAAFTDDAEGRDAERKHHEEQVKAADEALADLGFE